MSKKEKLISRFRGLPKDFTFDEALTLLTALGYTMQNLGKTSGSRVAFRRGNSVIKLHKPHPQGVLLPYMLKIIYDELKKEGLL